MKSIVTLHATMSAPSMTYSARDIDRRDRHHGYAKCGYHFVIDREGQITQFRSELEASIHDAENPRESISICLVGGSDGGGNPENNFTLAQWDTLRHTLRALSETNTLTAIRSRTPSVSSESLGRIMEIPT